MLEIDPNESIRICDEIIKKNINLGEAYYIKSCAYALLRDKKNAILNLRKAIETNIEFKFLAMGMTGILNISKTMRKFT